MAGIRGGHGCCRRTRQFVKVTLGQYLASIRSDRKMSLRQVEEVSGREVSNAYLSQLENGKILQPSPTVLNKLSEIYGIEYVVLMQLAGYLPPVANRPDGERHGRIATFAEHNLSNDEEVQLMDYLQFIRSKKRT